MLVIGGIYRHFKGGIYIIEDVAFHHEDESLWVIYRNYDTEKLYVRPKDMFNSEVDKVKYPDAIQKERFKLIGVYYDPSEDIEVCNEEFN